MAAFEDNSISHDITTDAGFRAWGQKIHDGLTAVGLVQTADVNQINLATVVTPSANNNDAGYEIWRFSDAPQSSDPIYLKLSYGRGGSAGRQRLTLAAGVASDGFGNLTNASAVFTTGAVASPSGNGRIYISFLDGALLVCSFAATNAAGNVLLVERLRDMQGALIPGDCYIYSFTVTGSGGQTGNFKYSGNWDSQVLAAVDGSPFVSDATVAYYRNTIGQKAYAPLRALLGLRTGIASVEDSGTIQIAGQAKTYKRLAVTITYGFDSQAGNNHDLLVPVS